MKHAGLVASMVALLVSACGTTPAPPPLLYFRAELPAPPAQGALSGALLVQAVEANGVFGERPLLFRRGPALEQYRYALWAEPPGAMVQHLLVADLRAAFGAQKVLTSDPKLTRDRILRTRIVAMEHELDRNSAVLTLEFTVSDADNRIQFVQTFAEQQALAAASTADYLKALEALLARAFAELRARLV